MNQTIQYKFINNKERLIKAKFMSVKTFRFATFHLPVISETSM